MPVPAPPALQYRVENNVMQLSRLGTARELFGKACVLVVFSLFATLKARAIKIQLESWNPSRGAEQYIDLASHLAAFIFLVLVLTLTLLRFKPKETAQGWEPRVSALFGTFLSLSLVALPIADLGSAMRIVAVALVLIGSLLSSYVLLWLGQSFSIYAQARQLVTAGPYAIVRHPLYVCEQIAMIGIVLLFFSPWAIAIATAQWMFQLRRMTNEERVLKATFPEYATYAAKTPKIIPHLFRSRNTKSADSFLSAG